MFNPHDLMMQVEAKKYELEARIEQQQRAAELGLPPGCTVGRPGETNLADFAVKTWRAIKAKVIKATRHTTVDRPADKDRIG